MEKAFLLEVVDYRHQKAAHQIGKTAGDDKVKNLSLNGSSLFNEPIVVQTAKSEKAQQKAEEIDTDFQIEFSHAGISPLS